MKMALWFLVLFGFSVSETDLFVESQLCNTVCLKELLVLLVRSLRRFEFQEVSVAGALKPRLIGVFQST
ncbi:hypothetical protein BBL94_10350 [Vibrio parahaemolyticus]|nr:hypothetical protein BBL94_10350 [Vibrio parahaemolyticus]